MNEKSLRYSEEKSQRWRLGEEVEPQAIKAISEYLSNYLGSMNSVVGYRFDQMWFDMFGDSEHRNGWVKGASDYCLDFENALIYAEIKTKTEKFHKTVQGGKTQAGSKITPYGCESYYLDIDPVWQNMNLFCEHLHINKRAFIIFFCNEDCAEIRFISLAKINELVQSGYNGKPLNHFSEGYGTTTSQGKRADSYLIPEDATINLFDFELGELDEVAEHNLLISCIKTNRQKANEIIFYVTEQGYYHKTRDCRCIRKKSDILTCAEPDVPKGKQRCKICFEQK